MVCWVQRVLVGGLLLLSSKELEYVELLENARRVYDRVLSELLLVAKGRHISLLWDDLALVVGIDFDLVFLGFLLQIGNQRLLYI